METIKENLVKNATMETLKDVLDAPLTLDISVMKESEEIQCVLKQSAVIELNKKEKNAIMVERQVALIAKSQVDINALKMLLVCQHVHSLQLVETKLLKVLNNAIMEINQDALVVQLILATLALELPVHLFQRSAITLSEKLEKNVITEDTLVVPITVRFQLVLPAVEYI